jgi:uncharacterized protein YcbK (DUF882 family)
MKQQSFEMCRLYEDMTSLDQGLSRRKFLSLGALTLLSGVVPSLCFAVTKNPKSRERYLSFYNPHTRESLSTVYRVDGRYLPSSLDDINYILRDHRSGEIKPINTRLLDLLYALKLRLRTKQSFHIISGYRSPKTNALLRAKNKGIAKNSFHILGKAADIYVPGYPLRKMRRAAMTLRAGGVGYYPRSKFVHVDVGPVRFW